MDNPSYYSSQEVDHFALHPSKQRPITNARIDDSLNNQMQQEVDHCALHATLHRRKWTLATPSYPVTDQLRRKLMSVDTQENIQNQLK